VYVANNPINAVDLRGDTITTIIDGQNYYYGSVNGTYGFIGSDGALYSGDNTFVGQLTSALGSLRSGSRGKALVDYLSGSAGSVQVRQARRNESNFATEDGKGIIWDPNSTISAPNTAGSRTRNPFIGLGHEMAHTEDIWKGTYNSSEWVNIGGKSIPEAEKYATHVENQIRSEHGMPLRSHYAMYQNGRGVPSTQILHTIGREHFSFYINQYKLINVRSTIFGPVINPVFKRIPYQY
jgi:hypothetical protein